MTSTFWIVVLTVSFQANGRGAATASSTWKPFSSDDGGFTVLMPGVPKVQKLPVPENGPEIRVFEAEEGDADFIVQEARNIPTAPGAAGGNLEETRDALVKSVKGTLIEEKRITLNGHPGLDLTIEATPPRSSEKYLLRSHLFVWPDAMYTLMVRTPKAKAVPRETARFFGSFRLTRAGGTTRATRPGAAATRKGARPSTRTPKGFRPPEETGAAISREGARAGAGTPKGFRPPEGAEPAPTRPTAPGGGAWTAAGSPEAGFTVQMPGRPREQKGSQDSPEGKVQIQIFQSQDGPALYVAQKIQTPKPISREDAKRRLEQQRDGFVKDLKGQLVEEKWIASQGHPGIELTLEAPAPPGAGGAGRLTIKTRFLIAAGSMYSLQVITPAAQADAGNAEKFFRSFQVGNTPSPRR